MLILKLTIVPLALLLLGLVERTHGPRLAGWLAGLPVVAGPLLWFVTQDLGAAFGSAAALGAYMGLFPWVAFTVTYTWCARRWDWRGCTLAGFAVWLLVALATLSIQEVSRWTALLPLAGFLAALRFYPRGPPSNEKREHVWWGLPARMIAGAVLTLVITQFSAAMGTHWSGLFATFPVMGSIVAISNHVQYGRHALQEAVAGMTMGLASVGSFCFAVHVFLGLTGIGAAFMLALAVSMLAHGLSWLLFQRRPVRKAVS